MSLNVIRSIKNQHTVAFGITATNVIKNFAKAVTTPSPTVSSDVAHGCIIKAVWVRIDVCGLAGSGVSNNFHAFIWKNPGNNLTAPSAESVGTSNEKKFVFKEWSAMIMRNQDGNNPYHWEGWLKIPKRYQRMGTDDTLQFVIRCTTGVTGLASIEMIYKWYT